MNMDFENLIIRFLSGEASEAEKEYLTEWIRRDPANADLFAEFKESWDKGVPANSGRDIRHALKKMNARIDNYEEQRQRQLSIQFSQAIAASLILVVVTGLGTFFLGNKAKNSTSFLTYVTKEVPYGRKEWVKLEDGSQIFLNSGSRLVYPVKFKGSQRKLKLSGEAYFRVAHDPDKPFLVDTKGVTTKVLGTTFNVKTDDVETTVSVTSGKVQVISEADSALILPGESIHYSAGNHVLRKIDLSEEQVSAWRDNTIIFDHTPLSEAATTLEKWYNVKIKLLPASIGACRISGKYRHETLENVLEAIDFSMGTKSTITKKEVTISGIGCD